MTTQTITKAWACGSCDEVHASSFAAEDCCKPEPYEVWICPCCGDSHHTEKAAGACCPGADSSCPNCLRDHSGNALQVAAIEVAGHCTTCNPLYTVDQQLIIEDRAQQKGGVVIGLNA